MKKVRLLCITCQRNDVSYAEQVEFACMGGADMIQLRDKTLPDRELLATARRLKNICTKYGVYFTVNNRIDIADASFADGVHIGQNDLPAEYARKLLGLEKIIGLSASNYQQALSADKQNIDYIGYGAIFHTQTKPESHASGLKILAEIKKNVNAPVIAIGGIDETNIADVIRAGADGVAVVSAVCGASDIKQAAEKIKKIILQTELEKRN